MRIKTLTKFKKNKKIIVKWGFVNQQQKVIIFKIKNNNKI